MTGALVELAVTDLGIIDDLRLVLGEGMTAVTGETGAGKTLIVEAIDLLVGGRADPMLVRPGASEARVEGRFLLDDEEVVLARVVPREGRSRAYVDGRLATATSLADVGAKLVDLHGQHAHQSLLATRTQRRSLDRFAGVDLGPLEAVVARIAELDRDLAAMGGDERARAREIDLLSYQLEEIDRAEIVGGDEDDELDREEDELAGAVSHRDAATKAVAALTDDGGAGDSLAQALAAIDHRAPFTESAERLRSIVAEVSELSSDLRNTGEGISDDPQRLEEIRVRRQLLSDLRRKYGDDLAAVLTYRGEVAERLEEMANRDARAAELEAARDEATTEFAELAAVVAGLRRDAAPELAAGIVQHLAALAMPDADIRVTVDGEDPADEVEILISANKGSPALPLRKVASGGELARTMLAIRLVLTSGPPVLVFDEVDAGIGGEAATAVGRALAEIAVRHQVFVVTHLPQVAAWADHHVRVAKAATSSGTDGLETTISTATLLDPGERRTELARMLSGRPDSAVAVDHASELLAMSGKVKS